MAKEQGTWTRAASENPGAAAEPMVRLERVGKRFGDQLAVDAVSFSLDRGAFLTILGPSGSGKTTVLRMIAGFIPPSEGAITLNGRSVLGDPPYARSIGMVFQHLALFPHMTAAENVAYPLRRRRWPKPEIAERVEHYLELVRLPGLGGRRIRPGGEDRGARPAGGLLREWSECGITGRRARAATAR